MLTGHRAEAEARYGCRCASSLTVKCGAARADASWVKH
jgi:hypothetical protein